MKNISLTFLIFVWVHLHLLAADIILAKQKIAQGNYNAAIIELKQIVSPKARYYEGWCHMRLGDCVSANNNFYQFITSYQGPGEIKWKQEAMFNIQQCGGSAPDLNIVPNNTDPLTPTIYITEDHNPSLPTKEIKIWTYEKPTVIKVNTIKIWYSDEDIEKQNHKEIKIYVADGQTSSSPDKENKIWSSEDVESKRELSDPKIIELKNQILAIVNNPMTEEPEIKTIVNNPMTEEPEIKTIVNNPMTEEPDIKTIVNNPMTEEPDRKTVTPKTTSEDITVTSKSHHFKILIAIQNTPDKLYMSLADVGPVSNEKANGNNYMYYCGFYPTKEKADEALLKVKEKGFQAARVMEFNKGSLEKEFKEEIDQPSITEVLDKKVNPEPKPIETLKTEQEVVKPKEQDKPKEQIQEVINSDVVSYHILFRVLPNPYEKFDDLKQFGPLYRETFDDKGNSRYLIGNTDQLDEAKILLEKVKKAGYPASFLAEYKNGSLNKILNN